jgi:uncharacterized protein (TIGR02444 family)
VSDFWDWAVCAYGGAGVADACLALQDADDQNVPLLLWAVWLACEGHEMNAALASDAADLARQWSESLIVPLRALRRRLKTALTTGDEAVRLPLREKIKAIELESERGVMALLAGLSEFKKINSNQMVDSVVLANLHAVATAWGGAVPAEGLSRLTEALSDGRFLRYNA